MAPIFRTALTGDVEAIYLLIRQYAVQGLILERSREDILYNIGNFIVAVISGKVIGTVTHYDYGKSLKEVRSLAVDVEFQGMGIGRGLLSELLKIVRSGDDCKIFTLTYKPEFFKKNGFKPVVKDYFPEKIWKDCTNCKDKENCGETALIFSGNL